MARCTLGSFALGLALLAGCLAPTDDSSPAELPGQPPEKEPAPAPLPDLKPPPEQPPPPAPMNAPGDEYDAAHHQVLYADCAAGALMAVDLAGGERRVVADAWPWSQPEGEIANVCVQNAVVAPGGERAYALVDRTFPHPDGDPGLSCRATELVGIETSSGETSLLGRLSGACCENCSPMVQASALQLDAAHGRLLHLVDSCVAGEPGSCAHELTSTALDESSGWVQHRVSSEQDGGARARSFTFDPADPQNSVILLLEDGTIDRLDFANGRRDKVATIQAEWDDIEIQYPTGVAMDPANQRMFVAAVALWSGPDALFVVVEVDLDSGEQTLLYDGAPTAEGNLIVCHPEPSFDSGEGRILMVEAVDPSGCSGRVFAVDSSTGELTLVAGGAAP
jgi:hypothetical protein